MHLLEDISDFLASHGIECDTEVVCGRNVLAVSGRHILPVTTGSASVRDAESSSEIHEGLIMELKRKYGTYPLIITEDRWHSQREMMEARLLSHLDIFIRIYARNCEVRKIDKNTAAAFLGKHHSYGDASCRYRYGLFLKRHTGKQASDIRNSRIAPGTLAAVATFSNARRWIKDGKTIRSHEWTRYASLPEVRLSGGMGRLLQAFIDDVAPDDIMTYADLEWSEGDVYGQLGFAIEGTKDPVTFLIDDGWNRIPVKPQARMAETDSSCIPSAGGLRYFRNFGSNKYRLKLTDYQ